MREYKETVAGKMKRLIEQWFTAEPLRRFALLFLEDKCKEELRFGRLTVIHYHMFRGQGGDPYGAAAAVELIILASDILDDLQDGDAPSKAWMQAPVPVAMHVGTSLIALSQQALLDSAPNREQGEALARLMNRQLLASANGQMLDLMNEFRDEQAYLDMVAQKSASLMVLACMAGVMAAGRPWDERVAQYASELGIAAQLRNDLRDLVRWDDKSDFLQRKRTLLTMFLLESLEERDRWAAEYYGGELSLEDVAGRERDFAELCERSGALLYGSVMGRMHYNRFEELASGTDGDPEWIGKLLQAAGARVDNAHTA